VGSARGGAWPRRDRVEITGGAGIGTHSHGRRATGRRITHAASRGTTITCEALGPGAGPGWPARHPPALLRSQQHASRKLVPLAGRIPAQEKQPGTASTGPLLQQRHSTAQAPLQLRRKRGADGAAASQLRVRGATSQAANPRVCNPHFGWAAHARRYQPDIKAAGTGCHSPSRRTG